MKRAAIFCAAAAAVFFAGTVRSAPASQTGATSTPIEHLVVLMQQNHTFDNYFGTYPGADGFPDGLCVPVDPFDPEGAGCVHPYHIGGGTVDDLDHSESTFALQYNDGNMDGFVHALDRLGQDGRLALGYYDDRDIPYYWNLADEYVLFDRFFSSAAGGSIWNRMYWVAGVPGNDANRIPQGGFGEIPTVFDQLEAAGISWKFYVSRYDPFLTYRSMEESSFLDPQVQWVPLLSFGRFIDDPDLAGRIVSLDEYFVDLENDELPAVSYVLALGATEHPLTSLEAGQRFTRNLLQALMASEAWESSAFILTYDDWGGWYDHVPPPQVDAFGYGFRVPALLVSPYARQGHIDSTELDFTSILRFIADNWGLPPLSDRSADANGLHSAFDFGAPPRPAVIVPFDRGPAEPVREPIQLWMVHLGYGFAALTAAGLFLVTALEGRSGLEGRP
ncbi:MAG TPA: alkaline phosphatase family protein [Anaerolineales bacterium]|nr:alkaline phosphatase family protein [Anaerolineales bacterium]